ncbi:MAG TPA: UDP-N-acetylmuramoyl-tripeptide--D-alanyl-D-alanine ligase [Actinomycetota bacterium]|nr:UDP-N-acetylmuramoyl-tripeptide--D-alanyl-D-alanine ligase [Actinomycetota bacterium]
MRRTLAQLARDAGGELSLPAGGDPQALATGVVVDSRRVTPGDLFAAFAGAAADGHDFLPAAFAAGAAAALVTRPLSPQEAGGPVIRVGDILAALQRLATANRAAINPVVIGITGSTGKTSTKDLVAAVASAKFATAAAERSYNNELGVPLTLLLAGPGTEVVVCELGARGPGHIAGLCALARPQIGVVTNVGVAHYELFGSAEAIAAAKGELPAALPEDGVAVLNADDPAVAGLASRTRASVVTYGLDPGAAIRAHQVSLDRLGRASFVLTRGAERAPVRLAMAGRHQVANALAAAGAGWALGLGIEEIAAGLGAAHASPWRMEVSEVGGAVIVNDAYNANPTSLTAALETCAAIVPAGGRLVAVLGYMAELGAREAPEHEAAGRAAAAAAHQLVVVGEGARPLADAAREAGLGDVVLVAGGGAGITAQIAAAVGPLHPGDVVLIKGSRVAGLERVAQQLEEKTREAAR